MKTHELKITEKYFEDVLLDIKTFEVRKDDRDYEVGDVLILALWQDGEYTGDALKRKISYILRDPEYVKEGYAILGIKKTCDYDIEYLLNRI